MYIGTSLGGCLLSLLNKEVSIDEVVIIITRTHAPTYDSYINVVRQYHNQGNPFARNPDRYELNDFDIDDVLKVAEILWHSGRIHQPRVFTEHSDHYHPFRVGGSLWFEIVPTNENNHPSVVDAYQKYKMLDNLTK